MNEKKIAIIVPLYNKRSTIERTMHSIFSQKMGDFEIVVVDDGSTDGSADLVRAMKDPRLRLISQKNAGPGAARNVGANATTAPFLAFLDADDEWLPDYLEQGLVQFQRHQDCVAYVSDYDSGIFAKAVPSKVKRLTKHVNLLFPPDLSEAHLLEDYINALHSSSTIVRRDIFNRFGGFYDRDRCVWGEDSYLWAQVLFSGPIVWSPLNHVLYHVENSQLGFGVTFRTHARPLSLQSHFLLENVPVAYHEAFLFIARIFAAYDAADLMQAGRISSAIRLRKLYKIPLPQAFVMDIRRLAGRIFRIIRQGMLVFFGVKKA